MKTKPIQELERLAFEKLIAKHPNFPYPIKPKFSDQTANGLTKCIIDYIELRGYQAERINSTGRQIDNRKVSKDVFGNIRTIGNVKWVKSSGQVGTADISATILGRSVKIEVKCEATNDKYQSKEQIAYQKKIEASGGIYLIVRNFDDFYNWFNSKMLKNE